MQTSAPRRWRLAVVVVVLLSGCAAWTVWGATADQRTAPAADQRSIDGRSRGSLLDTDVTRELEVQRRDAPGQPRGDRAPTGGTAQPGGATPSPVGGWLRSLGAVSAVLAAGAASALLVARRCRGRREEPQLLPAPESLPETESAAAVRVPEPAPEPDREVEASVAVEAGPAPAARRSPLEHAVVSAAASTTSTAVLVGTPVAARIEARERLFERRGAQRVPYVVAGLVEWRGAQWEMTVLDLSETGLRLRVDAGQPSGVPAAKDHVHVDVPVDGGRVRVAAQIAWRRTAAEGTEMGLVFRPLPAHVAELVAATCAARS